MSMGPPGGRPDKLGNEYERLWVVHQLLLVLDDKITAVTWESPSKDAEGIDVLVELSDGTRSYQSCKRENAGHGKWTLAHLNSRDVLNAAKSHLTTSANGRFVFVTCDVCSELRDLVQRALPYRDAPGEFFDSLSDPLQVSFRQLAKFWNIDSASADNRKIVEDMLMRCEVRSGFHVDLLRDNIRLQARWLFDTDPDVVRVLLADYAVAEDKLGRRIDRKSLETFLDTKDVKRRAVPDVVSVHSAIQSLQASFIDSIKPYLIDDQLIHRDEAKKLIDIVTSNEVGRPRLAMVHGRAGIGKSGVLFEMVDALQDRGVHFLPVRLDRKVPVGSADRFGREVCGLPSSPTRAIEMTAGRNRAVLILDQLDALRYTAAHTDKPMDVLTEVVREASNPLCSADIVVVVVCRTFDLEDDPRIAYLKSFATSVSIEIGLVEPEATRTIVNADHEVWQSLSEIQQQLLRQPQALYLWTRLRKSRGGVPVFRTHTDLIRAFWHHLFEETIHQHVNAQMVHEVLDELVHQMDEMGKLTAPISLIDPSKAQVTRFLQSSGVLRVGDNNQCVFTHQSYFDFLVANELNHRLLNGETSLLDWLRASDQSLFRRDQLRQVLVLQRDDDPSAFVAGIDVILRDEQIRFHLKHLIIRLLAQTAPPIPGEVALVMRLLSEDEWREQIFWEVLWNKPLWFVALQEQGHWTKWLDSQDSSLMNMALRMLGFMSRHFGDSVAAILSGYIDADEPWPERVAQSLTSGEVEEESDAVFDLRVTLVRRGHQPFGYLWWERLSKNHPKRCMRLLDLRLRLFIKAGSALRANQSDELGSTGIESHDRDEVKWLRKAAARCPKQVWKRVAPVCLRLEQLHRWAQRSCGWEDIHRPIYELSTQSRDLLKLCEQVLVAAGRSFARRRPASLKELVARWEATPRTRLIERSLLLSMHALPDDMADDVIEWLIAKSRRFRIGDSSDDATSQEPARRLIARFGKHCSNPILSRLENAILNYRDPGLRRMLKWEHENYAMKGSYYPNHHGKAQYILLSGLPAERLTDCARGQLGVWQRKFGKPPTGRGVRSISGMVGSTIPQDRLQFISDAQWLRLASGDWSQREHGRLSRKVMGKGQFGEASHGSFAGDMGAMARRQPARFAKLALRLPDNVPPNYLWQIIRAFEQKAPPEALAKAKEQNKDKPDRVRALGRELVSWRAVNGEEIEAILEQIGFPQDRETAKAICWLIEKRDDIVWSAQTAALLASIATSHSDPEAGTLSVSSNTGSHGMTRTDVFTSGINSVRGAAASAIKHLLFNDRALYEVLKPAIDSLMVDQNIGVRTAAIATCLPILNIDRDQAVSHFLTACSTDDDRVFESHYVDSFLKYALWSHREPLVPVIDRMAQSKFDECAKHGAAWVTAAWLYKKWCGELLTACRTGSQPQRHGVAEVVGQSPWETETAQGRIELLPALFDDDDKDVRHDAARVFWNDASWHDDRLIDLGLRFIDTQSFAEDPTPIVHGLTDIKGSLLKYSTVIYAIADQFSGPLAEAVNDSTKAIAADVPDLFKLLLRLYQQAQDHRNSDIQIACLDRWDSLLLAGVGGLRDAEKVLDAVDR